MNRQDAKTAKKPQIEVVKRIRIENQQAMAWQRRFDIAVFRQAPKSVRAVIEVKCDWGMTSIQRDARKIKDYFKLRHSPDTGYLLVYSEADHEEIPSKRVDDGRKRRRKLEARFAEWTRKLRWTLGGSVTRLDAGYYWGFVLLRLDSKGRKA